MSTLHYTLIRNTTELDAHQQWLPAIFAIHKQLRPQTMTDVAAYETLLRTMLGENQQILLAHNGEPPFVGLAMFNIHHNTYQNKMLFLEDFVIDEAQRGTQVGSTILAEIERLARENGCEHVGLDSGVHRPRAHKFYFTHGYIAESFHFVKPL